MPFETGKPKLPNSGRKKGTPNKNTQDVMALCDRLGCNPIEIMARFAINDWEGLGYDSPDTVVGYSKTAQPLKQQRITEKMRLDAASELAGYLIPKRKAIEHTGKDGDPIQVETLETFLKRTSQIEDKT
jgi:hypothetical protein